MSATASRITGVSIVCLPVHSGADIKESIKTPRHWPPAQKACNAEYVSIWWRHHVFRQGRLTMNYNRASQPDNTFYGIRLSPSHFM